ncbi:MAG: substrate-binding domain-containing protein, partial [Actinomycetota bacterium]|nr:substrate-binding domain-containing protein [Actinomycetota bacterium]
MQLRRKAALAALMIAAAFFAACGEATGADTGAGDGSTLSGSITIDGSSTVFPIAQAVAEDFQVDNPGTEVSVGFAGTGGGFEAFCAGETQISNASRPIEEDEVQCLEDAGIEWTEFQIAIDGLAVVTNPATDWTDCLTIDQLAAIYEPGSKVASWSDLDPQWPD